MGDLNTGLGLATVAAALLCITWIVLPELGPLATAPWLLALRHTSGRHGFYIGLWGGMGYGLGASGLMHAGPELLLALLLLYGLSFAVWGAVTASCRGLPVHLWALVAAGTWVCIEWTQAQLPSSLPVLLGDSQSRGIFLGMARLGGTYLISFQLIWVGAAVASWLDVGGRTLVPPILATAILALAARHQPMTTDGSLAVAVVQGGVPTWLYSAAEQEPERQRVESIYRRLTEAAPSADLTVWPETAVWRVWDEDDAFEERMRKLQQRRRGRLLFGVPRRDAIGSYSNSAVLLPEGEIADKQRLAIGAEATFAPGSKRSPLPGDLGVAFCLESTTPDYGRRMAREGARLIVVLAEGGRFGGTPLSWLHAKRSIVRAVETGLAVVHAGQHGYSMLVNADGSHTAPAPPYHATTVHGTVPLGRGNTVYVRYGDWILAPASVLVAVGVGNAVGIVAAQAAHHPEQCSISQ